jgi:hypothetical protein
LDSVDGHGTDSIEEDLEGAEEGLAEDRVENEGLEGGWEIGIETIDAEGLVVS